MTILMTVLALIIVGCVWYLFFRKLINDEPSNKILTFNDYYWNFVGSFTIMLINVVLAIMVIGIVVGIYTVFDEVFS